ncbi:hypothetical protein KSX_70230 [Ktedonospora formicarum]|uniref:Uncharacterized protein n=1 Tax=Ktedonospora formicarum TaxID=2778364 RepID=A0A8J3MXR0_9CHLR|nr:hypothetical protein KSX_70230 [Ktedonospora formicarum]
MESSDVLEAQQGMRCKTRILWQELDCPKPNFQWSICPLNGNVSETDVMLSINLEG